MKSKGYDIIFNIVTTRANRKFCSNMGTIRKIESETTSSVRYSAIVRLSGHPTRTKNFRTIREAKAWIAEVEHTINTRGKANRTSLNKTSLEEVFSAYLNAHPDTTKKKKYSLGALSSMLQGINLDTLSRQTTQKFINKLLETEIPAPANKSKSHKNYAGDQSRTYSPATVRRYFYDLKTTLEWWADRENYDLGDRFKRLEIPSGWEKPRDRILSEMEFESLLKAVHSKYTSKLQWEAIILLGIETGMRPSELLRLQAENCYPDKKFLLVADDTTKTKSERVVPLSNRAIGVLHSLLNEGKSGRVFDEIPIGSFSASFKSLCVKACIQDFRFHDLRHTALTRFYTELGLRDFEVATISGHKQLETLRRYVKQNPEELANKLNK